MFSGSTSCTETLPGSIRTDELATLGLTTQSTLEEGRTSAATPKKRKREMSSIVWNHMKKLAEKKKIKCSYCPRTYGLSTSTNVLNTHLKTEHPVR